MLVSYFILPVFRTQHLLIDTTNCHSAAHCISASIAQWSCTTSVSFRICRYTLTSSAKNLTVTPKRGRTSASSSMWTRNNNGPIPLPCITPLITRATSGIMAPTFVWHVVVQEVLYQQKYGPTYTVTIELGKSFLTRRNIYYCQVSILPEIECSDIFYQH